MSILISCQQEQHALAPAQPLPATSVYNVSYGQDSLQRMDVHLPEGRSAATTKSLVLIHGGSWNSGSKSDFAAYVDSFKKRLPDYAIFNLDYRLYNGGNTFPAQENDIRQAVDFIVSKENEYRINRSKIVLVGASAGGHLALLQAYKYRQPKIAAVVDFFGPTDLLAMYNEPWHPYLPFALQMVTGTNPALNATLYKESSPVNYVTRESAPTLILHGSNDPVVHLSQSKALQRKLEAAGVQHQLITYPGQRHGWFGATLSRSFDEIEKFLAMHVR